MLEATSIGPVLKPLADLLNERKLTIAVAESCTAGLLASVLSDLPDASSCFAGGVTAYTVEAKTRTLGISEDVLEKAGAVSDEIARIMAERVRVFFGADLGLSITCSAGPNPDGGAPVGLTYVAGSLGGRILCRSFNWNAGRAANRVASVEAALALAADLLQESPPR